MAHIDAQSHVVDHPAPVWDGLLVLCFCLLPFPYLMFGGLLGFLLLCLWQLYTAPKALLLLLHRRGFLVLSGLLLLSASLALDPGEAYLQMAHFLPFFWVWAALVQYLRQTRNPWQALQRWAWVLVVTAVPINLFGIAEYVLKRQLALDQLTQLPFLNWIYIGDLDHPRTFSLFDYPNTLANYLVMILGFNIGLLFLQPRSDGETQWWHGRRTLLGLNLLLTLLCLYCSGSRNGYLVAGGLLLVGLVSTRAPGWVRSLGALGLAVIILTTLQFGLAGRSLSWQWITDDPRLGVWGLALQLIRDRPLLGYGLGNYKLVYNGEVPGYAFIAHAHNLWLMLAAEVGLPFMLGFTVAVGAICWRGIRGLQRLLAYPDQFTIFRGYILCWLATMLFSMLDVAIFDARVNLLGWLSLAVLYCGPELSRQLPAARSA